MAIYSLKNKKLEIQINSLGAELVSLRSIEDNKEYMWEGNPQVWGRISPILFPFVGGLNHKEYRYHGKTYSMPQHGFARDMEFTLFTQTETVLWFRLKSTKDTEKIYPFPFLLEIGYEIDCNSVKVLWKVTNIGTQQMHFSIGGHPGFICPYHPEDTQNDCYIGFGDATEIINSEIDTNLGLLTSSKKIYALDEGLLKITSDIFNQDALVIENQQIHQVSLLSSDRTPYVTLHFDAPLFGVWSMPYANAPYICIEPWYGRCDTVDFQGTLEEREWGNSLEADQEFNTSYTIFIS